MFKILSKDPAQDVGSLLLPSGDYTKDQAETYKHLLEFHFPSCEIINENTINHEPITTEGVVNSTMIDEIVTEDRVTWAVHSFAPFKSQGLDKIIPAMLQQAAHK